MRDFIERAVNSHDLDSIDEAVDQCVSHEYRGTGSEWERLAPDFESLRAFYRRQATQRPDWHIAIQETIEVGEYVAVRALAGGTQALDDDGVPRPPPFPTAGEWLSVNHIVDGQIVEGRVVAWVVTAQA